MAIVAVVIVALLEPKTAGNCLDKLCASAFGASDGICAVAQWIRVIAEKE